ncbi:MAG: DUF3464 family protein [Cyanothece sp. SIO2G6]|nr:DUF3464 family protein [Cyanothece sp. SIO2G6]
MASKSGSSADKKGKGDRLPFEPSSNRKKTGKSGKATASSSSSSRSSNSKVSSQAASKSTASKSTASNGATSTRVAKQSSKSKSSAKKASQPKYSRQETAIPEAVSRRMIKRMAVLCGVPTVLGLSSFVISYFIVINGVIEVPPIAVLLVSLGFFGLGVLGISYGALSTSWDVDSDGGSLLGWTEFTTNIGRMKQAWQESRNQSRS